MNDKPTKAGEYISPAFPVSAIVYNEECKNPTTIINDGMSLRDYFAAKAMLAIISREDYFDTPADCVAIDAYGIADAMLKAREA